MPGAVRSEQPSVDVVRLVLAQPSKKNAIDDQMRDELTIALSAALANSEVRGIILSGAEGNFSAGGDIDGLRQIDLNDFERWLDKSHDLVRSLLGSSKPVVAAVAGVCAGAALGLALCADTIIAATSARFTCGFHRLGLIPDLALLYTLPRRIGTARAWRVINQSDPLNAEKAQAIGLVDLVVAGEALEHAAVAEVKRLASFSPMAFATTKRLINEQRQALSDGLTAELAAQANCIKSQDFLDRAEAFLSWSDRRKAQREEISE